MNPFDALALAILAVSGLIGLARGGARELITIFAFLIAVVVAVAGLRFTGPLARHAIHPAVVANAVAILVVFAAIYLVLRLVGARLTQRLLKPGRATTLLDRATGVAFGLVRGVLALGVFYLAFNAATPPERVPHWMKDAALYPLSRTVGRMLMGLAPHRAAVADVAPALAGSPSAAGRTADGVRRGYDAEARKGVDELVEKTR